MIKKTSLIVISVFIISVIMSGCGSSKKILEQIPTSTTQSTTIGTIDQKITSTTDSTSQITTIQNSKVDEKPVTPEKNPPGDIPDTQVFIKYTSTAGGYELQIPEGWARTENSANVKFVDKFDGVDVKISNTSETFSVHNINANQVSELKKTGRAIKVNSVKDISFKGGKAVLISYDSNSEPDSVTNKQIRLENESIYFYKNGKLAEITLWAPLGADNVDQWTLISNSFNWR
jgi:hypothetical protein